METGKVLHKADCFPNSYSSAFVLFFYINEALCNLCKSFISTGSCST